PYLTYDVRHWKAGQWHHVGATWDAKKGIALFVDGECVARRECTYDVVDWPRFNVGGDWAGTPNADASFDDLRLYPVALEAPQLGAVMSGLPLEQATVTKLTTPPAVVVGQPFTVQVQAFAPQALAREYPLVVRLDGVEVASATASPACKLWAPGKLVDLAPVTVTIPTYLRVLPGKRTLTAELSGAVSPATPAPATAQVIVHSPVARVGHFFSLSEQGMPLRDGHPFPTSGPGEGFLYEGVFYTNDETGRAKAVELIKNGFSIDALPCRLIDSVDCTTQDHNFVDYGKSEVRELAPGRTFRVSGPQDSVEQKMTAYNQERRALPGFGYTLANVALPVPHVLVAELPNDCERYTEIAIDAASGSHLAPHLYQGGPGDTRLIDLVTTYTGREYACDKVPFRQSIVFYPKSNACEVTVTTSSRDTGQDPENGAAVSRLWVYQLLDEQGGLYNVVPLPRDVPQRSVSLFFPEHSFLYTQWGFSGVGQEQRRASLLSFFDYLKFMGLNRFEFHPAAFGMNCYY
ncbi:MAG: LamG-like jellyroll fold domain-containing protein, partial [Armatimonadota bacterium]